ncbi:retron-type reverse transcriptase [Variovorax boronicumulans]|uniref:reverse transcriptase family protein n=1 Tax=Variovorax TaxID=34072 RepID=UPI00278A867B|nr:MULTISPECIES: reverse transcriptase family protein [Variovorax]MDQ0033738.1 retron-type reverse transcriptase [Variovorax boronicumulans]MDQ0606258.1 RNA-directed DNA polymerase [Variovorax sp. W1I1]
MDRWSPRHYEDNAVNVNPAVLASAIVIGRRIVSRNRDVQPVFTLNHLAMLTEVDYGLLRNFVNRSVKPYETFRIRKRAGPDGKKRTRLICAPTANLMKVQRWIAKNILGKSTPHEASVAFAPDSKLYEAAEHHCRSRWLIKLDVANFFESIPESAAYRVFRRLGFERLISFEMARICTRVAEGHHRPEKWKGRNNSAHPFVIAEYRQEFQGHLPQGAPTSPMLANLACVRMDRRIAEIAATEGLEYTRYADDMTFSTSSKAFTRARAATFIGKVYQEMGRAGLAPNTSKTTVVNPAGRKIVLGLLVDGAAPKLTRQFKAMLRQHIYYLTRSDVGPVKHARARGFTSVVGLRNHVLGLLGYAGQIELTYASEQRKAFETIVWPM